MKSVAIDKWGGLDVLKPHTLQVPEVGPTRS
jgi:hypothetical protein